MKQVLLSGCGNIGFRHLQAIAAMPTPAHVTIVEPNMAAHARITDFTGSHTGPHLFTLLAALPDAPATFDLAVIASSADVRRAIVEAILARHSVRMMVLEKVLFQRISDLDAVSAKLVQHGVTAFVNCGRRYFPGYLAARDRWAHARPLHIEVAGAAFGMCSNGIHLLDLAEFLNAAPVVSVDASGLKPGSIPAKRAGCVEVFGTLQAKLSNGATLRVTCADSDAMSIAVSVNGKGVSAQIDELARQLAEAGQPTAFGARNVSECWEIYDQCLREQTCGLTPFANSTGQHRLFLAALNNHLGLGANALCPIS